MHLAMKRFRFVLVAVLLVCLVGCAGAPSSEKQPEPIPLTVLFFNDLHGHLMPFEIKGEKGVEEVGGIARLAALIRQIREENSRKQVRTLVLVAGDILQGTPMSTVFKGDPDIRCLNAMRVDAMTVGNHEFDFGLENFLKLKEQAAFPFLSANIVLKESGRLLCQPALEVPLSGGVTFTIIGATTQELLTTTQADNVATLGVLDSVAAVTQVHAKAMERGPVLLLSHSRQETDRRIAKAMPDLVAIVGGHDQVLLSPYGIEGRVPILQAFEKGRYLGRLDLRIDPASRRAKLIDATYIKVTADIAPDPEVAAIVSDYNARLGQQFKEVIGRCDTFLDGEREHIRYQETALGNFITDIMRAHTGAQIAMINAGALRASIKEGPVTVEDVFKAMPYGNELVRVELTGAEIQQALQRAVRGAREDEDGGFLHVSGLSFDVRGRSAENIRVGMDRRPLDSAAIYSVVVPDFLASGGDEHVVFKSKPQIKTGSPLRELIVDTIRQRGVISAEKEGRIKRLE
ncbi:MAG: 5'-nucleotidase C-terminal domain-containing protein [Desulfatitalea sp.]|nr:5'-nucleotidase C-terminal domain-containing protein [Desulfatitalea sp.]